MEDGESLKKIISHSKEYGFVIPSSEIYEGLNAVYDYAHNGVLLKNNIREYWWKSMVQMNQDIIGVDSAIFMHPKTWIASGHVEAFNDPLIDNKDSKKRYEIVARQFIFRMREFEQMEMQFFIKPGTQDKWYKHWKEKRMEWHLSLGIEKNNYRFHDHEKLAHYADAASDIEFKFPFGFKELEGIHSRTDFDLKSHEKLSGKKIIK